MSSMPFNLVDCKTKPNKETIEDIVDCKTEPFEDIVDCKSKTEPIEDIEDFKTEHKIEDIVDFKTEPIEDIVHFKTEPNEDIVDFKTEPIEDIEHDDMFTWEMDIQNEFHTFIKNEQYIDDKNENIQLETKSVDKQFSYQMNNISTDLYSCEKCNFKSKSEKSLKGHIDSIHKIVTYDCDHCNWTFDKKEGLERHIKVHTQKKTKENYNQKANSFQKHFPCDRCDYKSTDKYTLKRHIRASHEKYACVQCDIKVSSKYRLKKHVKSIHPFPPIVESMPMPIFTCEKCELVFQTEAILSKHRC